MLRNQRRDCDVLDLIEADPDERLDSITLLQNWGFSTTCCARCGLTNSEIGGLLMQCGKCKKIAYCSKECWNAHLDVHGEFCTSVTRLAKGQSKQSHQDLVVAKRTSKPQSEWTHSRRRHGDGSASLAKVTNDESRTIFSSPSFDSANEEESALEIGNARNPKKESSHASEGGVDDLSRSNSTIDTYLGSNGSLDFSLFVRERADDSSRRWDASMSSRLEDDIPAKVCLFVTSLDDEEIVGKDVEMVPVLLTAEEDGEEQHEDIQCFYLRLLGEDDALDESNEPSGALRVVEVSVEDPADGEIMLPDVFFSDEDFFESEMIQLRRTLPATRTEYPWERPSWTAGSPHRRFGGPASAHSGAHMSLGSLDRSERSFARIGRSSDRRPGAVACHCAESKGWTDGRPQPSAIIENYGSRLHMLLHKLDDPDHGSGRRFRIEQTHSEDLKQESWIPPYQVSVDSPTEQEIVCLKETMPRQRSSHGWERPSWVLQSPLRKKGRLTSGSHGAGRMKRRGSLSDCSWTKPSWAVSSPLRSTEKGRRLRAGSTDFSCSLLDT